jgi:hypothetical protein
MILSAADTTFGGNGFDLSDSLVAEEDIERGGPPRDGIPSIDAPVFVSTEEPVETFAKGHAPRAPPLVMGQAA